MSNHYLDLLKLALTGFLYPESANQPVKPETGFHPRDIMKRALIHYLYRRYKIVLTHIEPFNPEARTLGRDWPSICYTMIGLKRLDNVQYAIETVIRDDIPGDVIECGAWRGGCAIFMRAVLREHSDSRCVWVADSFSGMPKPDTAKYPIDERHDLSDIEYLAAPLEKVKENFQRFGLLDDQVIFLKGWFSKSLSTAPINRLSVVRADGDLYGSTMDILTNLYDKVSDGGFIIIDDYYTWQPCRKAVTDFRDARAISSPIQSIDKDGVYWRKS
jgi:O-methyltransferase